MSNLHELLERVRKTAREEGVDEATLREAEDAVLAAAIRKAYGLES